MSGESISCQVCYSEYDVTDHLPRILLNCGHTICSKCLTNLITNRSSFKCPFDQQVNSSQQHNIDTFPINYAVKKLIEDKENRELCLEHQQRLRLVCLTDKTKICDECALNGSHNGHKIKPMTIIKQEANKKKFELNNAINAVNKHQNQVNDIFQNKRGLLYEKVKSRFEEIRKVFLCSELDLLSKTAYLLQIGVDKVNQELSMDAELSNQLSVKLVEQGNIFKLPNFIEVMDEDVSTSIARLNPALYSEHLQKVSQALEKVTESMYNTLSEETEKLLEYAQSSSFLSEKLGSPLANCFEPGSFKNGEKSYGILQLNTHLNFEISEGCLSVSVDKDNQEPKEIDLNEWKDLKKISLALNDYSVIQEDIRLMYYFWQIADKVTSVYVEFNNEGISESVVMKFLPMIFDKYKQIEDVEIWFETCKLNEASFTFLFSKFLKRLTAMKSLILVFDASDISDDSLSLLNEEVLANMKDLTALRVDLFKTKVTDDGIMHLFKNIERMREFKLHLQSTKVTDKCIGTFAKEVLPTMKHLKKLCVWLGKTIASDESIIPLFMNIQDLEELRLDLMATKVTNAAVDVLLEVTIPRLVSMKTFNCLLKDLNISAENLKKVTDFQAKFEEVKNESSDN